MNKDLYFNRELSWLDFNERVLDEGRDDTIPLLERLKFLAITANNMDEFFMVRVGSLHLQREAGRTARDPAGYTPTQQLNLIRARVLEMIEAQYKTWHGSIVPGLLKENIRFFRPEDLSDGQKQYLANYFAEELLPLLSPMALHDGDGRNPRLANLVMHLCVRLKPTAKDVKNDYALLAIPAIVNRFVGIPDNTFRGYMLVEDVIRMHLGDLFRGRTVIEAVAFRLTRNADMEVQEDLGDLSESMTDILLARKESGCVRVELEVGTTRLTERYLRMLFTVKSRDVYMIPGPLDLSAFMGLSGLAGYEHLQAPPWQPQPASAIDPARPMVETMAEGPTLLVHPFESFDPVVRLVQESADDPDVVAIKQILYRTSRKSPVVAALIRAAENGKYVTVVVELKARFDEQRNIDWARDLERAGVQVIYGVKRLKTHAKLLMVVRREAEGLRRYLHFGTGNYNETTARLYTDVSLLTTDAELGMDATRFFNMITGYSEPPAFRKLASAPMYIRPRIMELIENEITRRKEKQKAFIRIKVNSLVDQEIIDALYRASRAGVKVELNVRGICCLRPGVKGVSENIRVVSIIDRFLEHSRVFHFCHGGENLMFISSADLMTRNLDKRIELLVPVERKSLKRKLSHMLDVCFADTAKGRELTSSGAYTRAESGKKAQRSQQILYKAACAAVKQTERRRRTKFEAHRPSDG